IIVHGWFGAEAIIQTMGMPIAMTSPRTKLNTYAPIQKSDDSPRSKARPHSGQRSCIFSQERRIPPLPQRGQRSPSARRNFKPTDEGATGRLSRMPESRAPDESTADTRHS